MADFAQTQNTKNLQKFIQGIPDRGIPEKVTTKHLEGLGFKSKNDRPIIAVLRFLGVLTSDGTPSEAYRRLRNKEKAPKELAELIRNAYARLFSDYPDAHSKDGEALSTWFSTHTAVGASSVKNMVNTFSALCALADFNGIKTGNQSQAKPSDDDKENSERDKSRKRNQIDAQIAFNIQIQIPGEQSPDVYEAIFRNLGKYVLGIAEDE